MHSKQCFTLTFIAALLAGCQSSPGQVGGDRDAHGCIGSAGYMWCEKTAKCERAWEIAESQGLGNKAQTFEDYCNTP